MTQISDILTRWDANEGKPYKGRLIDFSIASITIATFAASYFLAALVSAWGAR